MATYQDMVLQSNEVPVFYNIAAAIFLWVMLAGILVLPGTFTSLEHTNSIVQDLVQHVPLLPIATLFWCSGAAGISVLWYYFRENHFWVASHLFL